MRANHVVCNNTDHVSVTEFSTDVGLINSQLVHTDFPDLNKCVSNKQHKYDSNNSDRLKHLSEIKVLFNRVNKCKALYSV